ncbi:MAG: hypothetical protein IMZ75_00585 [Actinobacteria bacterium]|nr:hypothetical protein [Actinomycetota bacterium]
MADFTRRSVSDMAVDKPDISFGTSGSMHEIEWPTQDEYWASNYSTRPYTSADRGYDYYRPGYRYGADSAVRYRGKSWSSIEPDLERGWENYRGDAKSTWQDIKDAVRDGWDRVTGHMR